MVTEFSEKSYKWWTGFCKYRTASIPINTEDSGITITGLRGEGGGVVRRIWLYVDGGDANSADKTTVNIYRNGETVASTIIPFDDFFGITDIATGIRTGVWVTLWVQDATNFKYSADKAGWDYFIKDWKITVKNNSGTNACTVKYVIEGLYFQWQV